MLHPASQAIGPVDRPHGFGRWPCASIARSIAVAGALCVAATGALAALDATSQTNDQSINKPTAWWFYQSLTASQVASYLTANSARLTEIEVNAVVSGSPRFTVRMVANTGSYAAPGGWWWYTGLTASGVTSALNANTARLIDLEPYDAGGGVIRYAAVMVSNTGTAARGWSWLVGVSSSQIASHVTATGQRIVDLDHYTEGGVKKYTAVLVANTGADAKSWQYWFNQTSSQVTSRVSGFSGRVVKLDRQSDGTYNFVQVRNTGSDNSAWWYRFGFTSSTALLDYANQLAARPVDIVTYVNVLGQRRFDATFIDNANADTRRMRGEFAKNFLDASGNPTRGIFQAYLKQVNGAVAVDLNSSRRAETASALKALHLLHAMREVQLGRTTLASPFTFYDYPSDTGDKALKDKCPNPIDEADANRRSSSFEWGLDEMMANSDNRTTRGVVLRYGMPAINATAAWAGLTSTTLRHDIGCAYLDPLLGTFSPSTRRNDTSAADLARIWEGVSNSSLLTSANNARAEFLESAIKTTSVTGALWEIVQEEGARLGKSSATVADFGSRIVRWSKGGSYGTWLTYNSSTGTGQRVTIRSVGGLIQLPRKTSLGVISQRTYAYSSLISDVPVSCFEDFKTDAIECREDYDYVMAYSRASVELFRTEIRSALATW